MATKTISDLTSAIEVKDTDVLIVEDGTTTMKVTKQVLLEDCAKEGHTHTIAEIESLREALNNMLGDIELATVATTGEYDDLINKPNIPLRVSELDNDMNYATQSFVTNKIAEVQLDGTDIDLSGYVTEDEFQAGMRYKADRSELFSGSYNDLTNKPTIPSVKGYATEQYVRDKIAEAQLSGGGSSGGGSGGSTGSGISYNQYTETLTINTVQNISYDAYNERLNIE